MTIGHDRLVKELPEFESKICELKERDPDFAKLLNDYNKLESQIATIRGGLHPQLDSLLIELKKRSLTLKDRMYIVLKNS
ncbi:YdcH family protein [Pseudoalteromonas luteoviolacea]|uniref:GTP-binding protein n=1 Tax=Pseudoalteromonas luteoviolacea S4060-1 TaxID=1365257 RepID=A0A161YZH6_9GAMM|nr:DUF465 domain-containing protein [Pseudoalteromonas luteoviolacea]KZN28433.1 hypothetical protein N480_10085 [Pseudoalteromonas luteoviolacea S2607]KZN68717.1 hypothetical protein N478_13720 [Pseudoalteromonas luteoviolacea S4060-1]